MCDKCQPHSKYWLHIADDWTFEERGEMMAYLITKYQTEIKEREMPHPERLETIGYSHAGTMPKSVTQKPSHAGDETQK